MQKPVPFERQLSFLRSHAPRCLNSFQATQAPLPDMPFKGHGQALASTFQLSCHLGDRRYKAFAFIWNDKQAHPGRDAYFILPPVKALTQPNELNKHLFDADSDGYDGELGGSSMRSGVTTLEARRIMLRCGKCQGGMFELMAHLEYPDELFAEDVGLADFKGREQDLFSWYTLIGSCCDCGHISILADFKCA